MNTSGLHSKLCFAVLAAVFLLVGAGCATTDQQDRSARPWNDPKEWEHGLPSNLYEGR